MDPPQGVGGSFAVYARTRRRRMTNASTTNVGMAQTPRFDGSGMQFSHFPTFTLKRSLSASSLP